MTYQYLFPASHKNRAICDQGHRCTDAVVEHDGRWFITFTHCAFNSPANNRSGYRTEAMARAAIRKSQRPHFTAKIEQTETTDAATTAQINRQLVLDNADRNIAALRRIAAHVAKTGAGHDAHGNTARTYESCAERLERAQQEGRTR